MKNPLWPVAKINSREKMKRDLLRFGFAILVLTGVSACSDPKAASEKNFKIAIQQYLDTAYPKCYFYENFPAVIPDFDLNNQKAILAAMLKTGLVLTRDEKHEETSLFGKKTTTVKPTFYLTEEGKNFYKGDVSKTLGGQSIGGFCVGKAKVLDVPQFTEPSDMLGQRISRVNYTYVVSDLPSWSKSPDILTAIPTLKPDVESESTPIKALDAVVLTNNGWVHERLFRK